MRRRVRERLVSGSDGLGKGGSFGGGGLVGGRGGMRGELVGGGEECDLVSNRSSSLWLRQEINVKFGDYAA